jgi:hypothetical protein
MLLVMIDYRPQSLTHKKRWAKFGNAKSGINPPHKESQRKSDRIN